MHEPFAPFAQRLREDHAPQLLIDNFAHHYTQLREGHAGFLTEDTLQPVGDLPHAETLPPRYHEIGSAHLSHCIQIRLNGGLGTSMGLQRAKSLLPVKDGLSFLDLIAQQSLAHAIPLLLMDSFATREDSLQALQKYPDLCKQQGNLPLDFLQHRVPKIRQADLLPADPPHDDPDLAWCPPGHGDIYLALVTSGLLDQLLARQIRYAFIANADNLGATLDTTILGYLVHHNLPFLMEVADRTPADRKGGHLARRREDGQLLLREAAQTTPDDQAAFQDIERYRYFNTNSIWIDLLALQDLLQEKQGILPLPLIRNAKTLDPRDPASTPVYQLETAMGSAIAIFQGAQALRVSRRRFAPVKTTDDLLAIRSDAYLRHPDGTLSLHPERQGIPPLVKLDPRFYKLIDQLDQRFPYDPPSLLHCQSLTIQGDITFGKEILCLDHTTLHAPQDQAAQIPDHTTLQGELSLSPS